MRKIGILFLLILSACTAGVKTSSLAAYNGSEYFYLPDDLLYSERRGIGALIEQGIKRGKYAAKLQDNTGTYFIGPEGAICQASPPCTSFNTNGGIWVSKAAPKDIRLFLIQITSESQNRTNAQMGALPAVLGAIDDGKYFLFPKNDNFAERAGEFKHEF